MISGTRVLYVGPMWEGGTCKERANSLVELGFSVDVLDTSPYLVDPKGLVRKLEHRLLIGPNVSAINRALKEKATGESKPDIVWVDKARWLLPSVLMDIKKKTGAIFIHYTPDPAFTFHTSRHFAKTVRMFDICVTTKKYELKTYRKFGAKKAVFTLQGIDDRFTYLKNMQYGGSQIGSVFIGHCEEHYMNLLSEAATIDYDLKIFGIGWDKDVVNGSNLSKHVKGSGVWGGEYVRTLSSAKIGFGLLCKNYPDQFTTRSFEIPAAGAMLLAERTGEHAELYLEGREAEFFSSIGEMKDKLEYYLGHEAERMVITKAGLEKAHSEYRWNKVLQPVIDALDAF